MDSTVVVGLAEIQVLKGEASMVCIGLGSCVSVCIMDPEVGVSGVAHVMLPQSFSHETTDRPAKFANTGVPQLIEMMERLGASRARMQAAVVGGAEVIRSIDNYTRLEIGSRNALAVQEELRLAGIRCIAQDLGGNSGRSVTLDTATGELTVKTVMAGEKMLCQLGS